MVMCYLITIIIPAIMLGIPMSGVIISILLWDSHRLHGKKSMLVEGGHKAQQSSPVPTVIFLMLSLITIVLTVKDISSGQLISSQCNTKMCIELR
ncbi:hypothetical protein VCHA53O466_50019 [Vibrio chagasii]|nr:hypothetical protein VCHA53O466_50019 [Vibrio chagasii]